MSDSFNTIAKYRKTEVIELCKAKLDRIQQQREKFAATAQKLKQDAIDAHRKKLMCSWLYKHRVARWNDERVWRSVCRRSLFIEPEVSEYIYKSRYYRDEVFKTCVKIENAAKLCEQEYMWLTEEGINTIL